MSINDERLIISVVNFDKLLLPDKTTEGGLIKGLLIILIYIYIYVEVLHNLCCKAYHRLDWPVGLVVRDPDC